MEWMDARTWALIIWLNNGSSSRAKDVHPTFQECLQEAKIWLRQNAGTIDIELAE